MQVFIFYKRGWKMPIHTPEIKVLGIWPNKWGGAEQWILKAQSGMSQTRKDIIAYKIKYVHYV